MPEPIPMSRPPVALPVVPPPLSPHKRQLVRNDLDKYFDDSRGMYLEGQSDQTIATRHDVPRANVTHIREVGYGPIKVTEEQAQLQVRTARLLEKHGELKKEQEALAQRVGAMETELTELKLRIQDAFSD